MCHCLIPPSAFRSTGQLIFPCWCHRHSNMAVRRVREAMPSKTGNLDLFLTVTRVTLTHVLCHPIESFAYVCSFRDFVYKCFTSRKLKKKTLLNIKFLIGLVSPSSFFSPQRGQGGRIGNVISSEAVISVQVKKGPETESDIYELLSPGKAFT